MYYQNRLGCFSRDPWTGVYESTPNWNRNKTRWAQMFMASWKQTQVPGPHQQISDAPITDSHQDTQGAFISRGKMLTYTHFGDKALIKTGLKYNMILERHKQNGREKKEIHENTQKSQKIGNM